MKYVLDRVILAKTFEEFLTIEKSLLDDGFQFLCVQDDDVVFTRNICGVVTNIAICCYWWEV